VNEDEEETKKKKERKKERKEGKLQIKGQQRLIKTHKRLN
jgi:hypothetical protein